MKIKRKDLENLLITLSNILHENKDEVIDISNAFNLNEVQDEFKLPERWCILATKENQKLLSSIDWYSNTHNKIVFKKGYEFFDNQYYTMEPYRDSSYGMGINGGQEHLLNDYQIITDEQFEKYIVQPYLDNEDYIKKLPF